jgi:hypothetical protein
MARRNEIFPDGGGIEHAEVSAANRGKVNDAWESGQPQLVFAA